MLNNLPAKAAPRFSPVKRLGKSRKTSGHFEKKVRWSVNNDRRRIMKRKNFMTIVINLEAIIKKTEKLDDADERRKILPLPREIKYLEKLVLKIKQLRGRLTAEDKKNAARIGGIERQALDAYEKGLNSIR